MPGNAVETKPITMDQNNFEEVLAQSELPVLFEFYAPWCSHCKALAPIMDEVAEELAGKLLIGQINADDNRELCKRFDVKAVPTLFMAKQGEVVDTKVNPGTKEALISWIQPFL